MSAKVTVTKHGDEYRWKVKDDLGEFESNCPTREEALEHALTVARSHGYHDSEIKRP